MNKSWKIVSGGIPFFNNRKIKLLSEFVPRFNDVTELNNSLSLFLSFDFTILEKMKTPIKPPIKIIIIVISV